MESLKRALLSREIQTIQNLQSALDMLKVAGETEIKIGLEIF